MADKNKPLEENEPKALVIHVVSNCALCNSEINYKGIYEMRYTE